MARLTIERAITNLFFKDDFQGLLLRESNLDSCCPLHALKQKNIVNLRCKGINTFSNQNLHQCFRFINFCIKATWYNLQHYHLEVQANPPKKWHQKAMLFSASMGETGLSHDIFFKFSLGPFEVVEVEWRSMLNFEAEISKFCNCSWKFGALTLKR